MEFKTAKRIKLLDENGNAWYQDGIVNADNEKEQFNTVSPGYTIVQHSEVVDKVEEALTDKNLNPSKRFFDSNEGARIRMELTFPDVTCDVEDNGKQIELRCYYDNSYNGTTGLRLEVGAKSPYSNGFLWCGQTYYHRHTKGVNVSELEKKLEQGIKAFQDKIKKQFKAMFKTVLTNQMAETFLEETIEDKKYKGSATYLKDILSEVKRASLKNKWQFYCLICDVITNSGASMENKDRQLSLLIPRLHKVIANSDTPVTLTGLAAHHTEDENSIQA